MGGVQESPYYNDCISQKHGKVVTPRSEVERKSTTTKQEAWQTHLY